MSGFRVAVGLLPLLLAAACGPGPGAGKRPAPDPAPPGESSPVVSPGVVRTTLARLHFAVTDEEGFTRRGPPLPGDWLATHEERGQTFDDYVAQDPVGATDTRRVLAFLPVGEFHDDARRAAEAAATFAGLWFDIPTRTLDGAELTPLEDWSRERTTMAGAPIRQVRTEWFLRRLLPRNLPDDAVCLVGVTMADLYPGPDWNYVFGEADLRRRVGVYSLVRYFPEFWGDVPTPANGTLALRRTLTVVVHEIGHTFGIEHCTSFECNMAGSNSLQETDRTPLHLCTVCLRKLQWNRGFDVLDRYRALLDFYREHGLDAEAEWTDRRIRRIQAAE